MVTGGLRRECRPRFCPLRASTRPRIKGQRFPQKEVFEDEASFPTSKRPATGPAGYLAVDGLRPSLFDNAIKRIAIRAVEMQRCASVRHR